MLLGRRNALASSLPIELDVLFIWASGFLRIMLSIGAEVLFSAVVVGRSASSAEYYVQRLSTFPAA